MAMGFFMKNIIMNKMSERRATWLELFFDLVFVVAIGALADFIRQADSLSDILYFMAYFLPVWWVWMGFSYYADQFETNDFLHKCLFLIAMFLILALAVSINSQGFVNPKAFVICYVSLRILLWALYARAWYLESEFRTFLACYLAGFGIGIVLWTSSLFVPEHWHFYCWGLAMLIELLAPILSYVLLNKFPTQVSHMDERFGLFVLIVLGEMVVLVGSSLSQTHFQPHLILLSFLGLLVIFQVWQLYFAHADQDVIHQSLRGGKIALAKSFVFGYNHFGLFVSLVMLAAGIGRMLDQDGLTHFTQNMILLSSSAFLLMISMIHWATPAGLSAKKLFLRLSSALSLFGFCFANLSATALMLMVATVLGGLLVFG
ncbi:MAG: low temperature requirement [Gammaproteobacteria bacterium]|jgi:low temperature requirement protein LtrA|nr:low temperature requirement [Gammaproteobacteria bacterium]